jgi:transcriptional regulator with XRE-family HTH domain
MAGIRRALLVPFPFVVILVAQGASVEQDTAMAVYDNSNQAATRAETTASTLPAADQGTHADPSPEALSLLLASQLRADVGDHSVRHDGFGMALKRARRAVRLTQAQLAERAGYSVVYIGMLERGARRPQRSTLAFLADALELSIDERAALEIAAQFPSASSARRSERVDAIPPAPIDAFLEGPTYRAAGRTRSRTGRHPCRAGGSHWPGTAAGPRRRVRGG